MKITLLPGFAFLLGLWIKDPLSHPGKRQHLRVVTFTKRESDYWKEEMKTWWVAADICGIYFVDPCKHFLALSIWDDLDLRNEKLFLFCHLCLAENSLFFAHAIHRSSDSSDRLYLLSDRLICNLFFVENLLPHLPKTSTINNSASYRTPPCYCRLFPIEAFFARLKRQEHIMSEETQTSWSLSPEEGRQIGNTWENLHCLWSSPLGKAWRPSLVQTPLHLWSFSQRASSKKTRLAYGPLQSVIAAVPQNLWNRRFEIHDTCWSTHSLLCRPRTTVSRLGSFNTFHLPFCFIKQWAAVRTWRLRFSQIS